MLSLNASGQFIFLQARFADFVGKAGDLRLLIDFMSPPGAAPWRPERFCFIAAVPSASTGVTAQDKVDRLEARTAFLLAEPDAQREAAVVAEPGAQQVVVAAEPGAPREAVAVAEPDAQQEAAAPDAAVVAEPDAQQAAVVVVVVVVRDAQPEAAAEPDAQQAVTVAAVLDAQQVAAEAAVSDAQPEAAVAAVSYAQQAEVVTPAAVAMKSRVRSLVASVEPAETAAVRLWFRATMVSAAAQEPALVCQRRFKSPQMCRSKIPQPQGVISR